MIADNPTLYAWVADTIYAVSGIRPSVDEVYRASGYSLMPKAAPLLVKRNVRVCAKTHLVPALDSRLGGANLIDFEAARRKRAGQ